MSVIDTLTQQSLLRRLEDHAVGRTTSKTPLIVPLDAKLSAMGAVLHRLIIETKYLTSQASKLHDRSRDASCHYDDRVPILTPKIHPRIDHIMKALWLRCRARLLPPALSIFLTMFPFSGQAKEHVDLQFWDMIWGPPEYIDTGKALVAQFNQEHPDITVTYRSIPWTNWYQTFLTAIGSGTAPDISTGAGYQAVQLYDQGAILPIDDVISQWKNNGKLDDFLPKTVDILKYSGHYVALPWAIDIRVWYYRKDLFAQASVQPPTTWQEFKAAAQALTKPSGDQYGLVACGDTLGSHYLYTLVLNNGGGLFTKDRKPDLDSTRNLEAFRFLSDLVQSHCLYPASAGYHDEDAVSAFTQGKGAITLHAPGLGTRLSKISDKVGVLKPLTGPHGNQGTIFWVNNIMLYKQGKHPDEAKIFLEWWSEHEKDLWTKGHVTQLPVRESFVADPYFQNNVETKFILDNYEPVGKTTAALSTEIFPKLNEIEGEGVMQTFMQNLLQGGDMNTSVKQASDRVKSIMED